MKISFFIHSVEMSSLQTHTDYVYQIVCDDNISSNVFEFTSSKTYKTVQESKALKHISQQQYAQKFLLIGDVGYTNAPTLPTMTGECLLDLNLER